jgi:hypothetical protein
LNYYRICYILLSFNWINYHRTYIFPNLTFIALNINVIQFSLSSQIGIPFSSLFTGEVGTKHCRRRKARTVFSDQQLTGLEKRFEAQRYLSTPERVELATALSLSETQVNFL